MSWHVKYQVRADWQYVVGLWNILFKTSVNRAPSLSSQYSPATDAPSKIDEESAGTAAISLKGNLWHGEYLTAGGRRKKIDGDIPKLGYALGLSLTERRILKNFHFMSGRVFGTHEIRHEIGHLAIGAMIFYGHPLFLMISPSERHSELIFHVSRLRRGDPGTSYESDGMIDSVGDTRASLDQSTAIDLLPYTIRRAILSRDPLVVPEVSEVTIRSLVPILNGMRMCTLSPKCHVEGWLPRCQDKFDSNAQPLRRHKRSSRCYDRFARVQSVYGLSHFHGFVSVEQPHQHKTI